MADAAGAPEHSAPDARGSSARQTLTSPSASKDRAILRLIPRRCSVKVESAERGLCKEPAEIAQLLNRTRLGTPLNTVRVSIDAGSRTVSSGFSNFTRENRMTTSERSTLIAGWAPNSPEGTGTETVSKVAHRCESHRTSADRTRRGLPGLRLPRQNSCLSQVIWTRSGGVCTKSMARVPARTAARPITVNLNCPWCFVSRNSSGSGVPVFGRCGRAPGSFSPAFRSPTAAYARHGSRCHPSIWDTRHAQLVHRVPGLSDGVEVELQILLMDGLGADDAGESMVGPAACAPPAPRESR